MNAAFSPGFRLSKLDVAVLVISGVAVAGLWVNTPWLAGIILFVVMHFFLFCNLVRMNRRSELIWAGCFVLLMSISLATDLLPMWSAFVLSAAITVVLVILETRRPDYHGVLWHKFNPSLPSWWESNQSR